MKRYNAFYLIHKGLRAMLYDAAITLQQTDFSNSKEAEDVLSKINDVLLAFDQHAHHEDKFILPAVELYEPELAASFEDEHVEDLRLSNSLKNLVIIYENTSFAEEQVACGSAIIKSFVEFLVFNLEHMAKEEMLLNQALWQHYTDEQILDIQQKLQATILPAEMQSAAKWMMRSISNADAIDWLKKVRQTAPEFIYRNLLNIANEELSEMRFAILHDALEAPVLV
jgi:hemerythrin HHE cation binding domain-containing protein